MTADELLREGKADDALAELQKQIRGDPANASLRVFLFQLLAVQGSWDRALNQLNVAAEMDPAVLAMAQMYRETLRCEVLRAEIFAGKRSPVVFGEPPDWIGWLLEALRLTAEGNYEAAGQLRDQAFESAPATGGSIDGQSFAWIADADTRLGPVLEAVVNGRYYWIPIQNIRRIVVEEPVDLRDVVWMPAHFTWANGGEMVGVIPTRYPGSETSDDPLIRLARKTNWREAGNETYLGIGQRMLATDIGDFSLMDVREIDLNVASDAIAGSSTTDEPPQTPEQADE